MSFKIPKSIMQYRGFTIVELLIVIVVIGILAGISLNTYANAQKQAKVTQAKSDLATVKKAMIAYKTAEGELPPVGDWWTYGTDPPSEAAWRPVLEDMEAEGYLGHGLVDQLVSDPWGHAYGYDDNDCNSWAGDENPTYLQSYGPNGIDNESGDSDNDDVLVLVSRGCIY